MWIEVVYLTSALLPECSSAVSCMVSMDGSLDTTLGVSPPPLKVDIGVGGWTLTCGGSVSGKQAGLLMEMYFAYSVLTD